MLRVSSVVRAAQAASSVTIKAPGLSAGESRLAAIRLYKDVSVVELFLTRSGYEECALSPSDVALRQVSEMWTYTGM